MKASRQDPANILVYTLLFLGVLSLSALGFDLLVSEPFGSLMVWSRTVSLLVVLAGVYQLMWLQGARRPQCVRVRS